jgi:S1-C subfamily serine protease
LHLNQFHRDRDGIVASFAAQDDARHFRIGASIQPGNSGGALVVMLNRRVALAALGTNSPPSRRDTHLTAFNRPVGTRCRRT